MRSNKTKIQAQAAKEFAERWEGRGDEKSDTQNFWKGLLERIFLVKNPEDYIDFEKRSKFKTTLYIDGYIPATRVLIEQKSYGVALDKPERQSDGQMLTPYQQACKYIPGLSNLENPRWIVTCNFSEFWVYDRNSLDKEPEIIYLKDLEKEFYRLNFLVDTESEPLQKEKSLSIKAGALIGTIYDKLKEQYLDCESQATLRQLNILCVRLVFCLYAEDAGLFSQRNAFHDYLADYKTSHLRDALVRLFRVLNTPFDLRDKYLSPELEAFPYVNGGLFSEEIEIPQLTDEIRGLILEDASVGFDWSEISPTIFGATFESTLNPETRKTGGMHYTSVENIHRVIDPLFLDGLWAKYYTIISRREEKLASKKDYYRVVSGKLKDLNNNQREQLKKLQVEISQLTFLDPACGSGNFLTESFISLRRLENEIIRALYGGSMFVGDAQSPIKVDIHQFYGIEVNDFAVSVARTALWIAEHQMLKETEKIASFSLNPLPLKEYNNIYEGNALRADWGSVVPIAKLSYIMGNPPFSGARIMNDEQKEDIKQVFGEEWSGVGDMDYVAGWYKIATGLMTQNPKIKTAFVSTNSITQGEQVAILWRPLMEDCKLNIDYAYRTFRWDNKAKDEAKVHCVIIGCSIRTSARSTVGGEIYDGKNIIQAKHINPYLTDSPDVWITSRRTPLCKVPEIGIGNKPIDGGHYLFSEEELDAFVKKEPQSEKYFHPYYGADEFINRRPRYCLWLGNCPSEELKQMPHCLKRVKAVRELRLDSKSAGTRKLADTPTRFHVENMPEGNYILIPRHSSENRKYIPMGFMSEDDICSDAVLLLPNATLYHFGILQSNVHMAWMRAVCGRLEMRYRYSKEIVYNNFPWPKPTEAQRVKIEKTAQAILDARSQHQESSLAALYDVLSMPPDLLKAHKANDKAVLEAYGLSSTVEEESEIVAELFKLYKKLTPKV